MEGGSGRYCMSVGTYNQTENTTEADFDKTYNLMVKRTTNSWTNNYRALSGRKVRIDLGRPSLDSVPLAWLENQKRSLASWHPCVGKTAAGCPVGLCGETLQWLNLAVNSSYTRGL